MFFFPLIDAWKRGLLYITTSLAGSTKSTVNFALPCTQIQQDYDGGASQTYLWPHQRPQSSDLEHRVEKTSSGKDC